MAAGTLAALLEENPTLKSVLKSALIGGASGAAIGGGVHALSGGSSPAPPSPREDSDTMNLPLAAVSGIVPGIGPAVHGALSQGKDQAIMSGLASVAGPAAMVPVTMGLMSKQSPHAGKMGPISALLSILGATGAAAYGNQQRAKSASNHADPAYTTTKKKVSGKGWEVIDHNKNDTVSFSGPTPEHAAGKEYERINDSEDALKDDDEMGANAVEKPEAGHYDPGGNIDASKGRIHKWASAEGPMQHFMRVGLRKEALRPIDERLRRLCERRGECMTCGEPNTEELNRCECPPEQLEKEAELNSWVGFDFDGTLAKKMDPFDPEACGEPIPKMIKVLRKHLDDGDTCKIFTARASKDKARAKRVIQAWLEENDLPKLDVVCEKDPGMVRLYDDRAVSVKEDEGTTKEAGRAKQIAKGVGVGAGLVGGAGLMALPDILRSVEMNKEITATRRRNATIASLIAALGVGGVATAAVSGTRRKNREESGSGEEPQEKAASVAERLSGRIRKARNETHIDPTPAQASVGNYKKGEFDFNGLTIKIENPKGTERVGYNGMGEVKWRRTMHADYGYFKGTKAIDGDAVDVFVGPDLDSDLAVAIDQYKDAGNQNFDETKFVVGVTTQEQGEKLYLKHYPRGWRLGPVSTTTVPQLKKWLSTSSTKKPFKGQKVKAAGA